MTFRSVVRSYQCDLALSFARLRIIVEYVAERLGYLWSIALVDRLSSSRICSHFIRGRGEERVFFARKCERPRQCCARVVVLEHERAYSLSAAFLGLVDVFGIMVEIAVSTAVDGLARSRGVDCQV